MTAPLTQYGCYGNVIAALTMSVDGFIALPDDSVGHLFDWDDSGEVALAWPGMGLVSHVNPASAGYLRDTIEGTGAIVVGRRVYDYTNGWGGDTPSACRSSGHAPATRVLADA